MRRKRTRCASYAYRDTKLSVPRWNVSRCEHEPRTGACDTISWHAYLAVGASVCYRAGPARRREGDWQKEGSLTAVMAMMLILLPVAQRSATPCGDAS